MNKKYIVRLTAKERRELREIVRKLNGSSQKVRRAQMLLKRMLRALLGPMSKLQRRSRAVRVRLRSCVSGS